MSAPNNEWKCRFGEFEENTQNVPPSIYWGSISIVGINILSLLIMIFLWCKIIKSIKNNPFRTNQDEALVVMILFLIFTIMFRLV